jgi:hypothetical protein
VIQNHCNHYPQEWIRQAIRHCHHHHYSLHQLSLDSSCKYNMCWTVHYSNARVVYYPVPYGFLLKIDLRLHSNFVQTDTPNTMEKQYGCQAGWWSWTLSTHSFPWIVSSFLSLSWWISNPLHFSWQSTCIFSPMHWSIMLSDLRLDCNTACLNMYQMLANYATSFCSQRSCSHTSDSHHHQKTVK